MVENNHKKEDAKKAQENRKLLKEAKKAEKIKRLDAYREQEKLRKEKRKSIPLTKEQKLKKILGWTAVVLVILFTIGMVIVTSFLANEDLKDGSPAGIPLNFSWSVAVGTLISLVILLALVYRFFWDPIGAFLQARKEKVEKELKHTEDLKIEAAKHKMVAEKNLKLSKEQAEEIIALSKKEGNDAKKDIIAEARKESSRSLDKTREQINKEKEALQDDIREEIIKTAILAAEKIIEKNLDVDSNKKMVEDLISSLKE